MEARMSVLIEGEERKAEDEERRKRQMTASRAACP